MNDDTIISLAIEKTQRARYRELLANPQKRKWLLDKLNHKPPFDTQYVEWFSSFTKALKTIQVNEAIEVYILSAAEEIDGKMMSYKDAIEKVKSYGWGTIICISPALAVYYAEMGERSAIIRKKA